MSLYRPSASNRSSNCALGSGSAHDCSACCLVRSTMSMWWAATPRTSLRPENVPGLEEGIVWLGSQQCDTPDQSAARNITLSLRSRRDNKSGMREVKERRKEGNEGGAGNPDQSAARKTRHNTRGWSKKQKRRGKGERRSESPDNPDQSAARGVRSREERKSKQRTGESVRRETGKGHETPKHRGSKEREERTTKE